ncbi:MAG: uracil-DNA glycosylase, partial [Patescibacteria group bacterium]|nr:uracil-DNA glycosylase [Patescibacteria group bacterium]
FIGEAPGENEAKSGRPFCGAAGKVLDGFLKQVGLSRKDVYITNIVKDRPPGNRDPSEKEISIYAPFLIKQIEVIQPRIIATLGRFAMGFMMKNYGLKDKLGKISSLHGKVFSTKSDYGQVYLVPLYHPAVVLYQNSMKKTLENDFQVLTTIDSLV